MKMKRRGFLGAMAGLFGGSIAVAEQAVKAKKKEREYPVSAAGVTGACFDYGHMTDLERKAFGKALAGNRSVHSRNHLSDSMSYYSWPRKK